MSNACGVNEEQQQQQQQRERQRQQVRRFQDLRRRLYSSESTRDRRARVFAKLVAVASADIDLVMIPRLLVAIVLNGTGMARRLMDLWWPPDSPHATPYSKVALGDNDADGSVSQSRCEAYVRFLLDVAVAPLALEVHEQTLVLLGEGAPAIPRTMLDGTEASALIRSLFDHREQLFSGPSTSGTTVSLTGFRLKSELSLCESTLNRRALLHLFVLHEIDSYAETLLAAFDIACLSGRRAADLLLTEVRNTFVWPLFGIELLPPNHPPPSLLGDDDEGELYFVSSYLLL